MTRIFSQQNEALPDGFALVRAARSLLSRELALVERRVSGEVATLAIAFAGARFEARVRPTTADDFRDADRAELAGRAGGMATLARRCRFVWELADDGGSATFHELCATIAAVALGPILPADGATLYGVRGARERAERQ